MVDFLYEAFTLFEYTRQLRRDFHRHPELGFQEVRTAGIVARELNQLGLEVFTGIGKTGVIALLEGSRPGPVVLLRFDMDALPVQEETGAEYASEIPGLMHACGHDAHTAIGLTVARMLEAHRSSFAGKVKFVFQPAEEGLGGAQAMIVDGLLENPKPDISLALHMWNEKSVGWLGITSGPLMAAADLFHVRISGRGGHGAAPHLAIDPLLAAAQIITALQSIVARNVAPLKSAVISVTSIKGGDVFNVIPPMVEMMGTIRTFELQVRDLLLERFNQVVTGVAQAMGCQAEITVQPVTSAVINDASIAQRIQAVAEQIFPDNQVDTSERTMVSEDMAEMMQTIPGCYILIGSANPEKGLNAAHHHPRFDFDEDILPMAAALIASAAVDLMSI